MADLIKHSPTVIPACDVSSLDALSSLVAATSTVEGIGAYKVGLELALSSGLPRVIETIRAISPHPVIYDHQKGATDIPAVGSAFARVCAGAGVDAVILFPLAGPSTEEAWISACQDAGLRVIVGGFMTHTGFSTIERGFISEIDALRIYEIAAESGVTDFIVPGTRPEAVRKIRDLVRNRLENFTFYAPGFIAQGGTMTAFREAARDAAWHAIIGTAIYGAEDIPRAAHDLVLALNGG